jgi:hypothetical protein
MLRNGTVISTGVKPLLPLLLLRSGLSEALSLTDDAA